MENVIIPIVFFFFTIVIKLLLSIFTYFIQTLILIYTGLSVIQELCEDTTTSVIINLHEQTHMKIKAFNYWFSSHWISNNSSYKHHILRKIWP